ncbi:Trichodiene synthase [Penicillium italicum]|uniref:Trichodiene synthase n=1 Tax=Penicillium italicum TaxID=40296 RepID=A0A0A2L7N5_PENIT|nr:Trichodiene synthase [Penicillium italicum]WPN08561.1 PitB [Penicillium italicum]
MAPIEAESTFAYHGLETKGVAHADVVKSLIKQFLESVRFDRSLPFIKDRELESAVWTYFKSLNMGAKTEASVHKALKLSVTLTHQAYTNLPFENKVLCAVQILYMFLVDDIAEHFMDDLRCFCQNFVLNNPHNHPLLANFDTHLRYLSRYYGPYCHSTIIKCLFDYVNGRIIENEMEEKDFTFPPSARLMPMFLRTKVGAAEILVSMMFPKAVFPEEAYLMQYFPAMHDLVLWIDFTNDILSYYKEFVIREEKGNFVANFAETHEMSHLDVLRHLVGYAPQVLDSAYRMLGGKKELLLPVHTFVNGWIMLCTAHRRYHLVELFEDEGYLLPYDEDA